MTEEKFAAVLMGARQYCQAGNLDGAENAVRHILQIAPGHGDALRLLNVLAQTYITVGNAQKNLGHLDLALVSYRHALRCQPELAAVHLNLANTLRGQKRLAEACTHAQQAVRLQPQLPEAQYEWGAALQEQGVLEKAAAVLREALRLRPQFAEALNRLGLLMHCQGQLAEAVISFQQAVQSKPGFVEVHYNLGNALRILGQRAQAAAAYQEVIRLKPDCAEAYYSLGGLAADQEQLEEAAAFFEQALRLKPDLADAHAALGVARAEQGRVNAAADCLQKALRLKPAPRVRITLATRLPVIYQSVAELEDWRNHLIQQVRKLQSDGVVLDLTEEPAVNLFYLAYQGRNDRDILREIAGLYRAPQLNLFAADGDDGAAAGTRKIRVGFISSYFRAHTIGHWLRGLVARLSRDQFEVTVLSVGSYHDEIAASFRQHVDRYLEIPKHLPWARRAIADLRLDVLFYADIGMDPTTCTLAFSRLAPVQCATLGHPVTTGSPTIDYFISTEDLETDESDQHYTEKMIRLKSLPVYYYRPQFRPPLKDRQHFGFTKADHIYACMQSSFKFHPDFDSLLGGILRGDLRGRLVLPKGLRPHWDDLLRNRFSVTLPDVIDRIHFLPRLDFQDYLSLLKTADVLLDTLHFGGGSTSYEALAVGTPIVTLPSRFLRGRITYALYKQMQMVDCVAENPQDYIGLALRLGTDADYREMVHQKIEAASPVLYENVTGIQELERFFQDAISSNPQSAIRNPQ